MRSWLPFARSLGNIINVVYYSYQFVITVITRDWIAVEDLEINVCIIAHHARVIKCKFGKV